MNRSLALTFAVATLLAAPFLALAAEVKPEPALLGAYVPDDAWIYVDVTYTPKRDFIDAHWQRVFDAVQKSGIGGEFKNFMLSVIEDPAEKASFEEFWATTTRLLNGVRWRDLVAREFVFAERFNTLMPDILVLCRPVPETMPDNVKGLAAILQTLAGLDEKINLTEADRDGAHVWSLEIEGQPFGVYMVQRGEVLGLMIGRAAADDVIALLAGQTEKKSIVQSPRYKAALTKVPPAEFSVVFMDLDRLFKFLPKLPDTIFDDQNPLPWGATAKKVVHTAIDHFDFFDYSIMTTRMDGAREFSDGYCQLKSGCEAKPLYRMCNGRKPVPAFEKYVPVEATGFNVSDGIDWTLLYETVLNTIRQDVPNGADLLTQWETAQTNLGFSLHEDLLSWISGEHISVQLPSAVQSPFGASGEAVTLFRVTDPAKAKEKLAAGIAKIQSIADEAKQPITLKPAQKLPVEGFYTLSHPMLVMMMIQPCIGVWNDWLVFGTSENAVVKVMDTAAGKNKTVFDNPRFQAEGLKPDGPVATASFTDLSSMGQQLGSAFFMMGMVFGMMPDEPEIRPLKSMMTMIGRLGPAVAEINFLQSTSSVSTFRDNAWVTKTVTNYRPLESTTQPAEAATKPGSAP